MRKMRIALQSVALLVFMLALTSAAHAQATRTWVSGVGDDVNPCSRTAPCKTFAGAISKTADKGEIDALDPGGFGTITITKNITLEGTNGGGFGSILNAGTTGVVINDSATATPNTIKVILRNLSIQGAGTGIHGINFVAGNTLYVENCDIQTQTSTGLRIATPANVNVFVDDTDFDNTNIGINSVPTAGTVALYVSNSRISGNNSGIVATNTVAQVANSVLNRNLGAAVTDGAIVANTGSTINVSNSIFTSNITAIRANTSGTIRVSLNQIYNNSNGLTLNGGTISSDGQNRIAGNGASAAPNGAAITLQ